MTQCKSCGTEIIWCRTAAGKMMPLDAAVSDEGTWGIIEGGGCYRQEMPGLLDGTLHQTHWQTCLGAAQHRKPKE
jgi:hypothetical protein